MLKAKPETIKNRALPACPHCKSAEAVRAMSASPGHFFCARCQLDLPLNPPLAKGEYLTKGRRK